MAYIYTSQIILKGNQGRSSNQELEGRTELEFTGECSFSMASTKPCSGVYFLLLLLFLFFNKIEDFVPGMPQLLKPRLSYFYLNLKLKKKKSPHSYPEASLIEAFPQVRIFLGVLSLCYTGKKKNKQTNKQNQPTNKKPNQTTNLCTATTNQHRA